VESWGSNLGAIEFSQTSLSGGTAGTDIYLTSNAYYSDAWRYKAGAAAAQYYLAGGEHAWRTKTSGTADAAVGFSTKMTLTNGGALLIGTTSASGSELFKVDGDAVITGTMEATIDGGSY
jgi:hypothetical protein